ncbi:MAG: diguanylate cyclase, partial [Lachnospiraceae bacterium]|nr:diguanylate cyclase [Lachnospiraceae bacterium]
MTEDNRDNTIAASRQDPDIEEKKQRVMPVGDVRGISIETLKRGLDERLSEKEDDSKTIKGIAISNFAYVFLFSIMLFTLLTIISMINVSDKYHNMLVASNGYNEARNNIDLLRAGSDCLTEEVRQFVITGDKSYMDNYFTEVNVTRRRDKAVEGLSDNPDISRDTVNKLVAALNKSNKLKAIECHAMHLTAYLNGIPERTLDPEVLAYQITEEEFAESETELFKQSYELVFGDEYMMIKDEIMEGLEEALDGVENDTGTELEMTSSMLQRTLTVQIILTLLVLIVIIIGVANMNSLIIRPIKNIDEKIKTGDNLDLEGALEIQTMAHTYNIILEQNNMRRDLLSYKAEHDELTQLLNRNAFEKITYKLKDLKTPMGLLVMDLDKFKSVNDRYGHSTGDEALKVVSKV